MNIPDKLAYLKGERTAEIIVGILTAAVVAADIAFIASGTASGALTIVIMATMILCGVLSVCSVWPQHTNIFDTRKTYAEKDFRKARRVFIAAKAVFTVALFPLSMFA